MAAPKRLMRIATMGDTTRPQALHRQRANPTGVSYRMLVRGGEGSGGPVWPTNSLSGEATISAATTQGSTLAGAGIAAKGTRQTAPQIWALPSSPGGQPSQSLMSPPAIAAADMASDMLVAFAACAIVPAAKTASRTIAKMRESLSMASMLRRFPVMSRRSLLAHVAHTDISRILPNPPLPPQIALLSTRRDRTVRRYRRQLRWRLLRRSGTFAAAPDNWSGERSTKPSHPEVARSCTSYLCAKRIEILALT